MKRIPSRNAILPILLFIEVYGTSFRYAKFVFLLSVVPHCSLGATPAFTVIFLRHLGFSTTPPSSLACVVLVRETYQLAFGQALTLL
jgi:hypothetical protein